MGGCHDIGYRISIYSDGNEQKDILDKKKLDKYFGYIK
jgi:hypothetical protein